MIITTTGKSREPKYPCLMIADELIVLFHEKRKGTVVSSDGLYKVGLYSTSWDQDLFKKYKGLVTLEND